MNVRLQYGVAAGERYGYKCWKGERINIRHNTIIKEKKYGT